MHVSYFREKIHISVSVCCFFTVEHSTWNQFYPPPVGTVFVPQYLKTAQAVLVKTVISLIFNLNF